MLSRRHIRVKVLQALYMYYNDGKDGLSVQQLTRALEKNVTKLYELYLYLLRFLEEMGRFVQQYDEETRARYIQNERDLRTSLLFFQNPVLQKLIHSENFHNSVERYRVEWKAEDDLLRKVFLDLKNQDIYKEFIQFGTENPVLNQEILLFVLKHYTANHPLFQHHLEEEYYNWLDDRKIVLQMAAKTIQTLAMPGGEEHFLQPLSQNADDLMIFAKDLLRFTLAQDEKLDNIIKGKITKWEPHQIALIDGIILKMSVCEFLNFPSIPAKVSINEYIELAKTYSTPQSKKFVNGVLDAILKDLKKEGVVSKN